MASVGSYKYLYERLAADRFQQLCAALVVDNFENVAVFPVREKDGGRDMVSGTGEDRTILQVKWTGMSNRKPATWLKSQIKSETDNIKRLVDEGYRRYILMTNVEGSGTLGVVLATRLREPSRSSPRPTAWRCRACGLPI